MNNSLIVDLFQLQLKSSVECQKCFFSSNRFDPATFLALPVPTDETQPFTFYVFNSTSNQLKEYIFNIPIKCQISSLFQKLRQRIENEKDEIVQNCKFILTRVVRYHIVQIFTENELVPLAPTSSNLSSRLVVYIQPKVFLKVVGFYMIFVGLYMIFLPKGDKDSDFLIFAFGSDNAWK